MNLGANWSQRVAEIESFKVMDLLKRAGEIEASGVEVVHMELGEPNFPVTEPVARAAATALAESRTRYTPAAGLPQLRERIAQWYQQRYNLTVPAERILVTTGASSGLLMVLSLLCDAGSKVLLADPGYPCNRQFLRFLDAAAKLVPADAAHHYQLTADLLADHWCENTVGALVASPSNPTGTLLRREQLAGLHAEVSRLGGSLIVDELYHGLTYGCQADSILSITDDAFVINSFSKYFGLTGWRLGWIVVPEAAVAPLERLAQNLYISPPTLSQYAAMAAFSAENVVVLEQRREAFHQRRDLLIAGLRALGFEIPVIPEGAFYVYADSSKLTDDSFSFCWELLEKAHVACTPGLDFGSYRARDHIRFSYTTSYEQIELGLARLKQFLQAGS